MLIAVQQIEGGGITAGRRIGAKHALSALAEIFLIVRFAQNLHVVVVVITPEVDDHGRLFSATYRAHCSACRIIGFKGRHYIGRDRRFESLRFKMTRAQYLVKKCHVHSIARDAGNEGSFLVFSHEDVLVCRKWWLAL
ncbi:hypothetical protein D9M71_617940 [compost metagenome]